jgi:hypothetical protein
MKHFEEHSLEEILNLSPEGYTNPAVVDGKLVRCEGTECTDCDLSCRHTTSGRLCALHFIEWLYSEVQEDTSEGDPVNHQEKRGRRTRWIPVAEKLPKNLEEVIVTWVNTNPESYYSDIKGIPFSGAAVFYDGDWYWYSNITQDILAEYGRCEDMLIDDAIEITAWMPFPEPYKEENSDGRTD